MTRWFRMYDDVLNDPKVQRLTGELFKLWINCLCVASKKDGRFPSWEDMSFMMRIDITKLAKSMQSLIDAGLVDTDSNGSFPHAWPDRQFKSDVSNERVSRYRERKRNAQCNVTETPNVTPPDTDTDTEYRTEQKEKKTRAKRALTPIPADYAPNETTRALAAMKGLSEGDLEETTCEMREWATSKDERRANWDATHQGWVRREAKKWKGRSNGKSTTEAADRLIRRFSDEAARPIRPMLSIASK